VFAIGCWRLAKASAESHLSIDPPRSEPKTVVKSTSVVAGFEPLGGP